MWHEMLSDSFTCSKRHLGMFMLLSGFVLVVGGLGLALLDDFGFSVMLLFGGGGGAAIVGVTLLPLKDFPA